MPQGRHATIPGGVGRADSMPARHIYALKVPHELQMTDHQQELRDQVASIEGLLAVAPKARLSGIQEGSRYWAGTDVSDGRMVVGAGLLDKCDLKVGGTVVLYDKFMDKSYAPRIDETHEDSSDTNVYLSQGTFNKTFGKASDWFDAYASQE